MQNNNKIQLDAAIAGPLFMLSSALLFTALNLMVKLINDSYAVWHIGFFRFFGGTLLLLAVFGRRRNPFMGDKHRLLILRGCIGSIAFITLISAIRILPVSTALVLFYVFPAFAAVFAFFIYKERIRKTQIACMATAMVGVAVLLDFQVDSGLMGKLLALTAGMFAGLTVTLIRSLRQTNGPVIIYLYFCTIGSIITLPMFLLDPIIPANAVEWAMILGIVFTSVSAQLLMNQGFFYCRGWEGGVFLSSELIFTAVVGIIFLHDPVSWRFWLGSLLILGSVVTLNRLKK